MFRCFICVTVFLWFIVYSVIGVNLSGSELAWFLTLYAISAYIKKYGSEIKIKRSVCAIIVAVLTVILVAFVYVFDVYHLTAKIPFFNYYNNFLQQNFIGVLLISLFIFIFFMKTDIGYKKPINFVSQAVFGVYLIHDNNYWRMIIWEKIFKVDQYVDKLYFIPYTIGIVAAIFIVCSAIELIRIYVFERNYMKLVNKLIVPIKKLILKLFYKLVRF